MNSGKWAVTHASSPLAEAILEQMADAGIPAENVILLDTEDHTGKRLSYADTYIETLDHTEFDYEGLIAVLLLEQDAELEDLLQHADCFVISHYFDEQAEPVYTPYLTQDVKWTQAQPIKLATAEFSSLLSILKPMQSDYAFKSIQLVNILSSAFYGKPAIDELASQTINLLSSQKPESKVFPIQQAFNMQPVTTPAEMGLQLSLLMGGDVSCSIQSLLVPAFYGMACSVFVECAAGIELKAFIARLKKIKGIKVSKDPVSPMSHCQQGATIYVAMAQESGQHANRVQFWMIADSSRNGLVENYIGTIKVLSESNELKQK